MWVRGVTTAEHARRARPIGRALRVLVTVTLVTASVFIAGALGLGPASVGATELGAIDLHDRPVGFVQLHAGVEDPLAFTVRSAPTANEAAVDGQFEFAATLPRGVTLGSVHAFDGRTNSPLLLHWHCRVSGHVVHCSSEFTPSRFDPRWRPSNGVFLIVMVHNTLTPSTTTREATFRTSLPGAPAALLHLPLSVIANGVAQLGVLGTGVRHIGVGTRAVAELAVRNNGSETTAVSDTTPLATITNVTPPTETTSWASSSPQWRCTGAPTSSPTCAYVGPALAAGAVSSPLVVTYTTNSSDVVLHEAASTPLSWTSTMATPGPWGQSVGEKFTQQVQLERHLAVKVAVKVQPVGTQALPVGGILTVGIEESASDGAPGGLTDQVIIPKGTWMSGVDENGWSCPAGVGTITCTHRAPLIGTAPTWFEVTLHALTGIAPSLGVVGVAAFVDHGAGHGANLALIQIVRPGSTGLAIASGSSPVQHRVTHAVTGNSAAATPSPAPSVTNVQASRVPRAVFPHTQGPAPPSTLSFPGVVFTNIVTTWNPVSSPPEYQGTATATVDNIDFPVSFNYVDGSNWDATFSSAFSAGGLTLTPSGNIVDTAGSLSTTLSFTASGSAGGISATGTVGFSIQVGTVTANGDVHVEIDGLDLPVITVPSISQWTFTADGSTTLAGFSFSTSGSLTVPFSGNGFASTLSINAAATADGITLAGTVTLTASNTGFSVNAGITAVTIAGVNLPVSASASNTVWTLSLTTSTTLAGFTVAVGGSLSIPDTGNSFTSSATLTVSGSAAGVSLSGSMSIGASMSGFSLGTPNLTVSVVGLTLPVTATPGNTTWTFTTSGTTTFAGFTFSATGSLTVPLSGNGFASTLSINAAATADGITLAGTITLTASITGFSVSAGITSVTLTGINLPVSVSATNTSWTLTMTTATTMAGYSVNVSGSLTIPDTGNAFSSSLTLSISGSVDGVSLNGTIGVTASNAGFAIGPMSLTITVEGFALPATVSFTDASNWSLTLNPQTFSLGALGNLQVSGTVTEVSGLFGANFTVATVGSLTIPIPNAGNSPFSSISLSGAVTLSASGNSPISISLTGMALSFGPVVVPLVRGARSAHLSPRTNQFPVAITYASASNWSISVASNATPQLVNLGPLGTVGVYGCFGIGPVCGFGGNTGMAITLGINIATPLNVGGATLAGTLTGTYNDASMNGLQVTSSLDLVFYSGVTPVVTIPINFSYTNATNWTLSASAVAPVAITNLGATSSFTVSGSVSDSAGTITGTLTLATNAPITILTGVTLAGTLSFTYTNTNAATLTGTFTLTLPLLHVLTVSVSYATGPSATASWSATVTADTAGTLQIGSVSLPVPSFTGTVTDTTGTITWNVSATFISPISLGGAVTLQGSIATPLQFAVGNTCAPVGNVALCTPTLSNPVFLSFYGVLTVNLGFLGSPTSVGLGASFGLGSGSFALVATLPNLSVSIAGLSAAVTSPVLEMSYNNPGFAAPPAGVVTLGPGSAQSSGFNFLATGTVSVNIGLSSISVPLGITYSSTGGIVIYAAFPNYSPLSLSGLSLDSLIYTASQITAGLNGSQFSIPAHSLVFGGSYHLPNWITTKLALPANTPIFIRVIYTDPSNIQVGVTVASLSLPLGSIAGYSFYLGPLTLVAGLQSGTPFVGINETGCMLLPTAPNNNVSPNLISHTGPCSQSNAVPIVVSASFNIGTGNITFSISAGTPCEPPSNCTPIWNNVFGVSGLSINSLSAQIAVNLYSGTPAFGFSASGTLPNSLLQYIGVNTNTGGVQFNISVNISLTNPCVAVSIAPAPVQGGGGGGNQNNLRHPHTGSPTISILGGIITANQASFVVAPTGCTVGLTTYAPGLSLAFTGTVLGVSINVMAQISLVPFVLHANVSIASFHVGGFTFNGVTLTVNVDIAHPLQTGVTFAVGLSVLGSSVQVSGTILLSGVTLTGTGTIVLAGFTATASLSVTVTLQTVAIQVSAAINTSFFQVSFSFALVNGVLNLSAMGTLDPAGFNLGTVNFTLVINTNTNYELLSVTGTVSFAGLSGSVQATLVHTGNQVGLYLAVSLSINASFGSLSGTLVIGNCAAQGCGTIYNYVYASISGNFHINNFGNGSVSGSIASNGSWSLTINVTVSVSASVGGNHVGASVGFGITASVHLGSGVGNWSVSATAYASFSWYFYAASGGATVGVGFTVGSSQICVSIAHVGSLCANI